MEKKLLKFILNKKNSFDNESLKFINYNNLVRISSKHLFIPTLYHKMLELNMLSFLEKDFKNYIKKIFEFNRSRNKILCNEVKYISDLLIKNNINYCFIKGAAMIIGGYYDNYGERMVGDIDILVSQKDYSKTISLFKSEGYFSKIEYEFFENESQHYPRLINKSKTFAIEIHKKFYETFISTKEILDSKRKIKNNGYIPSAINMLKICICNHQLGDFGLKYLNINLKAVYDCFLIERREKIREPIGLDNIVYRRFYQLITFFKIKNYRLPKSKNDRFFYLRMKLKNYRMLNIIDYSIIKIYLSLNLRMVQAKKIIESREYRNYLLFKKKYY